MTGRVLAAAVALILGIAGVTNGHADGKHEKKHGNTGAADKAHEYVFGAPGDPGAVTRTVDVEMNDAMRFVPDRITVKRGETIRFLARNVGTLKHELVLGTVDELKAHAELMRKFPEMEHVDPNQVVVDPGKTGELVWRFTTGGTVGIGCLQPGHFEAGMSGSVTVVDETGNGAPESGQATTSGVVRRVDKPAGKVTIRHGPIENLGMPGMTMVFRVRDPAMLDRLREGDRIRFVAEKVDGLFTLIRIEPDL